LAPNDQGLATKIEEDLRGTARDRVGYDIRTKHLDVPVGRFLRVLADDVDVIKDEGWIAHGGCPSSQQALSTYGPREYLKG
jgi:hypothetical protein